MTLTQAFNTRIGIDQLSLVGANLHPDATATGGAGSNRGVYSYDSSPSIRNSSITGDDFSIYNDGTAAALVADTMLDGTVDAGGGLTCVGAYDETFVALDEDCAVIP